MQKLSNVHNPKYMCLAASTKLSLKEKCLDQKKIVLVKNC